jgi:hypothetical protein
MGIALMRGVVLVGHRPMGYVGRVAEVTAVGHANRLIDGGVPVRRDRGRIGFAVSMVAHRVFHQPIGGRTVTDDPHDARAIPVGAPVVALNVRDDAPDRERRTARRFADAMMTPPAPLGQELPGAREVESQGLLDGDAEVAQPLQLPGAGEGTDVDRDEPSIARNWWAFVVRGLLVVLLGTADGIWPGQTLGALIWLFGAYALVQGVFDRRFRARMGDRSPIAYAHLVVDEAALAPQCWFFDYFNGRDRRPVRACQDTGRESLKAEGSP